MKATCVLISCSEKKLPHKAEAIELYRGSMFDVLRKHMPDPRPDVLIISAKYGLLVDNDEVDPYDQIMTPERATELIGAGLPTDLCFDGPIWDEVIVCVSQAYRPVADAYLRGLLAIGQIRDTTKIRYVRGGIGQQRAMLGRLLSSLSNADEYMEAA